MYVVNSRATTNKVFFFFKYNQYTKKGKKMKSYKSSIKTTKSRNRVEDKNRNKEQGDK